MTSPLESYRSAEQAFWRWAQVTPTEQFLSLEKPKLKVRVQEAGEGPPALFVTGVLTAGAAFAPLMRRLPQLRCITLDRPGCGLSDPWTLDPEFRGQAVETLESVLDALGLQTAILIGSSLGALWSTWFALARPERVRHLVLLGPSIGFPGVHAPLFMRLMSVPGVRTLIKKKMKPSDAAMRRVFAEMGHHKSLAAEKIPQALFDWGVALQTFTPTQSNELEVMPRAFGVTGPKAWIQLPEPELRELRVPTLVVSGTDDTHGGPVLARRVASLATRATLETLNDAGHLAWLDDAEGVARAIRSACLAEAPRAATG